MNQDQIKRAISNVNASFAIEGLDTDKIISAYGQKILEGKIDVEDAIKLTIKNICFKL